MVYSRLLDLLTVIEFSFKHVFKPFSDSPLLLLLRSRSRNLWCQVLRSWFNKNSSWRCIIFGVLLGNIYLIIRLAWWDTILLIKRIYVASFVLIAGADVVQWIKEIFSINVVSISIDNSLFLSSFIKLTVN